MAKTRLPDLRDRTLPEILRRLGQGEGLATICADDDMPNRATVQRWCEKDRELAEQVAQARDDGFFLRAERAVEDAKSAKDALLGRLAFDAERWYLSKLCNAFADRAPKIDHQTNVQVNIDGGNPFGKFVEFMDRAAASLASGSQSTNRVVDGSETGSDCPEGGLDDVAPSGGPGLG